MSHRVLFLPGASGAGEFWRPVADRLPHNWETLMFDWPGLGDRPRDPHVNSMDDLVNLVLARIDDRPVDLVAQSMGGIIAMRVALKRPESLRRLVLVATSGGIDLSSFDLDDWRADYRAEYPNALPFITDSQREDLSEQLSTVRAPTLLLWAIGDRISPPSVGQHLASKLPLARLVVLGYDDHMFARDHAAEVTPLILEHLSDSSAAPRQ